MLHSPMHSSKRSPTRYDAVHVKHGPLVHTATPLIRKPSAALVGRYVKVPWPELGGVLVAKVVEDKDNQGQLALDYFRAWADKRGDVWGPEFFEYPAYLATEAEVAAARAEQEAVDAARKAKPCVPHAAKRGAPRRLSENWPAHKQRTPEATKAAHTLLDLAAPPPPPTDDATPTDETAPTDTSDADGETPTTAPPTDDDETSPLA